MARPKVIHDAFTAIADPTRRRILDVLRASESTVSRISTLLPISQPTISEHLKVLRNVGLVEARQCGRQRIYSLRPAGLADVRHWILSQNGHAGTAAPHEPPAPAAASSSANGQVNGNGQAGELEVHWSPEID